MAKENNNKSFVLRIDAATMDALEQWAADEFRSINGQLQWIIADALRRSGRQKKTRASSGGTAAPMASGGAASVGIASPVSPGVVPVASEGAPAASDAFSVAHDTSTASAGAAQSSVSAEALAFSDKAAHPAAPGGCVSPAVSGGGASPVGRAVSPAFSADTRQSAVPGVEASAPAPAQSVKPSKKLPDDACSE